MNKLKLMLAYSSHSLGVFSCNEKMPEGKIDVLRKILGTECCIYPGVYLQGSDLPKHALYAEIEADNESLKKISRNVQSYFPESLFYAVSRYFDVLPVFGEQGTLMLNNNETCSEVVSFLSEQLYGLYCNLAMEENAFVFEKEHGLELEVPVYKRYESTVELRRFRMMNICRFGGRYNPSFLPVSMQIWKTY